MVREQGHRYEQIEGNGSVDGDFYELRKSRSGPSDRYQFGRPSLKARQGMAWKRWIRVYRNGQPLIAPKRMLVTRKKYPSLEHLIDEISSITKQQVKMLYTWPSGHPLVNISEIEDRGDEDMYVCSTGKQLTTKDITFDGRPHDGPLSPDKHSRHSQYSTGTSRSDKPTVRSSMNGASKSARFYIKVTSSTNSDTSCSVYIDPMGERDFEKVLGNIRGSLGAKEPKVTALYSMKKTSVRVDSYSSLSAALRYGDAFWACGKEGPPSSRDTSPKRNGYQQRQRNDSTHRGYEDHGQRNGYTSQPENFEDSNGRSYRRHQKDPYQDDQDETDQDLSPPPAQRDNRRSSQSPQRDKRSTKRYNQRRDDYDESPQRHNRQRSEEDETDRRGNRREQQDQRKQRRDQTPPRKGRNDDDESPQRHNRQLQDRQNSKRSEEDETDRRGNRRAQPDQRKQRRDQTPPRKEGNKKSKKEDDESNGNSDDDDDRERDHISDEEMEKRCAEMEIPDEDMDDKIKY